MEKTQTPKPKVSPYLSNRILGLPEPIFFDSVTDPILQSSSHEERRFQTKLKSLSIMERSKSSFEYDYQKSFEKGSNEKSPGSIHRFGGGKNQKNQENQNFLKTRILQAIKKYESREHLFQVKFKKNNHIPEQKLSLIVLKGQQKEEKRGKGNDFDPKKRPLARNKEERLPRCSNPYLKTKSPSIPIKILNQSILAGATSYQHKFLRNRKSIEPLELEINKAEISLDYEKKKKSRRRKIELQQFGMKTNRQTFHSEFCPLREKGRNSKAKFSKKEPHAELRGWEIQEEFPLEY